MLSILEYPRRRHYKRCSLKSEPRSNDKSRFLFRLAVLKDILLNLVIDKITEARSPYKHNSKIFLYLLEQRFTPGMRGMDTDMEMKGEGSKVNFVEGR